MSSRVIWIFVLLLFLAANDAVFSFHHFLLLPFSLAASFVCFSLKPYFLLFIRPLFGGHTNVVLITITTATTAAVACLRLCKYFLIHSSSSSSHSVCFYFRNSFGCDGSVWLHLFHLYLIRKCNSDGPRCVKCPMLNVHGTTLGRDGVVVAIDVQCAYTTHEFVHFSFMYSIRHSFIMWKLLREHRTAKLETHFRIEEMTFILFFFVVVVSFVF